MTGPLVLSVIMPNYNHAEWVGVQLEALLRQSRPADEIIVVDDASTDNSIKIIESIAEQHSSVKLLRNEKNLGVVKAVNRGLQACTGNCLYFAGSDDLVLPGFFAAALSQLEKYPQAAFCFSVGAVVDLATGRMWCDPGPPISRGGYLSPDDIVHLQKISPFQMHGFAAIIRKEPFDVSGGLMPELGIFCDSFLQFVMAYRYGACYVADQCFALWRVNRASYSQSVFAERKRIDESVETLLRNFSSERYRDVVDLFRDSGSLMNFRADWSMLRLLRSSPRNRQFLTPLLQRRLLWRGFRRFIRSLLPNPMTNAYRFLKRKFGNLELDHSPYLEIAGAELRAATERRQNRENR